jgi:hypothetical protein
MYINCICIVPIVRSVSFIVFAVFYAVLLVRGMLLYVLCTTATGKTDLQLK